MRVGEHEHPPQRPRCDRGRDCLRLPGHSRGVLFFMSYHRGGCQTIIHGERDGLARPVSIGEACVACPGCDLAHGDIGLIGEAATNTRLVANGHHLQIVWQCPECNRTVEEQTDYLSVIEDAKKFQVDPLCVYCRKARVRQGSNPALRQGGPFSSVRADASRAGFAGPSGPAFLSLSGS